MRWLGALFRTITTLKLGHLKLKIAQGYGWRVCKR